MTVPNKPTRAAWLQGPAGRCETVPNGQFLPWRIVLLGAPGVGKGTQAELLNQRLLACHLSTGDVFRAAANRSEGELSHAMKEALGYMRRGELVPDTTVWELVQERGGMPALRGRVHPRWIPPDAGTGGFAEAVHG